MNTWSRYFGIMLSLMVAFFLGLTFEGSYITVFLFVSLVIVTNQGITYLSNKQKDKTLTKIK